MNIIGLDFETSGTDPWGDAAPIQIGLSHVGSVWVDFESLIGGWHFGTSKRSAEFVWSEKSEEIHGIPRDMVQRGGSAPSIHEVDVRAAAWMYDQKLTNRMWNVTVGWNVAGFDRQFVTRHMPNLNRMLSYRTIDLNALVFALSQGQVSEYKRIKSASKDYAVEKLVGSPEAQGPGGVLHTGAQWHDALFDAKAAVHSYAYLTKLIHGQQER